MDDILQMTCSNMFKWTFLEEIMFWFDPNFSSIYSSVPNPQKRSLESGHGLVPNGDKPLPESMMTNFADALMCQ